MLLQTGLGAVLQDSLLQSLRVSVSHYISDQHDVVVACSLSDCLLLGVELVVTAAARLLRLVQQVVCKLSFVFLSHLRVLVSGPSLGSVEVDVVALSEKGAQVVVGSDERHNELGITLVLLIVVLEILEVAFYHKLIILQAHLFSDRVMSDQLLLVLNLDVLQVV